MYYRSHREDVARSNIGPGSYNLAYRWRTDDINYPHLRAVTSAPVGMERSTSPSRVCCLHKPRPVTPGDAYEKPWKIERSTRPDLSPRGREVERLGVRGDIETVRNLPKY